MKHVMVCAFAASMLVALPAHSQSLHDEDGYAARRPQAPMRTYGGPPDLGGGFVEMLLGPARQLGTIAPMHGPMRPERGVVVGGEDDLAGGGQRYARLDQGDIGEPARPAVDPRYRRQVVAYSGKEPAGTIVINTPDKFLYLVQGDGTAIRYGIGVGRPGFTWAGVKQVSLKREWPDWRPPNEMLKRRPDLPRYMPGGADNPLGARALYLGSSLYRIHGSNEPWTIGTQVSSGCIRMRNEDVIDLYGRVKVGTKVVVL